MQLTEKPHFDGAVIEQILVFERLARLGIDGLGDRPNGNVVQERFLFVGPIFDRTAGKLDAAGIGLIVIRDDGRDEILNGDGRVLDRSVPTPIAIAAPGMGQRTTSSRTRSTPPLLSTQPTSVLRKTVVYHSPSIGSPCARQLITEWGIRFGFRQPFDANRQPDMKLVLP